MISARHSVLGVEGGGSKTEWVHYAGGSVCSGSLPASNLKLISDQSLENLLRVLPNEAECIGVFLAGCATPADHKRLHNIVAKVWPNARIAVGSDRDSGFATAFGGDDGIAVISGTGSSVTGRFKGRIEKAGGWGHLIGDKGGAYELGVRALQEVLWSYDIDAKVTPLAAQILQLLALNRLEELVNWARSADKMSVGKLAPAVFAAAKQGDVTMSAAIQEGAHVLAQYTSAVAQRLGIDAPRVRLLGGVFRNHPEYFDLFKDYASDLIPRAQIDLCTDSGAIGAAQLAAQEPLPAAQAQFDDAQLDELAAALTEQQNPSSARLDEMTLEENIELFIAEEKSVTAALGKCRNSLASAVKLVERALRGGGRLFYVGAGTSGRLGVLDASEIPPTFSVSPELVQGIIAGGAPALHRAVEGAEDHSEQGALAIRERGVQKGDVVCGISASGRTPFVIGALAHTSSLGAHTIFITCNPKRQRVERYDVEIDLPTGAEIVTGSTRLKAGTATKLALNIISTCAMIRLGKVRGNLMVDLNASNVKLRDRATRLISKVRGCSYEKAQQLLERQNWNVRACLEHDQSG